MGWDVTNVSPSTTTLEFVREELKRGSGKLIALAKGREASTYYAAWEHKPGHVMGIVYIAKRSNGQIASRIIGEDEGPHSYGCPKVILDMLTPTNSEWAKEWRTKCVEANAIPKVKFGDMVKFDKPITFMDGSEYQTLKFETRNNFRAPDTGRGYRVTNWRSMRYSVVSEVAA